MRLTSCEAPPAASYYAGLISVLLPSAFTCVRVLPQVAEGGKGIAERSFLTHQRPEMKSSMVWVHGLIRRRPWSEAPTRASDGMCRGMVHVYTNLQLNFPTKL